jgi:hypothetical protein
MNKLDKEKIKNDIVSRLKDFKHLRKIIIFGSFNSAVRPNDIDLALVDDSDHDYLTLACAYRKKLRGIKPYIAADVLPVSIRDFESNEEDNFFLDEIRKGALIYEA